MLNDKCNNYCYSKNGANINIKERRQHQERRESVNIEKENKYVHIALPQFLRNTGSRKKTLVQFGICSAFQSGQIQTSVDFLKQYKYMLL